MVNNPAMAPSLAGIVSDPLDEGRRVVPASQRADGSVRKERKVKPGHVPSEDVAKYRPGQGNLRAQHALAQANHQAPPSPAPAPATAGHNQSVLPPTTPAASARRPSPADFLTFSNAATAAQASSTSAIAAAPLPTPPASPTKPAVPSHSKGASASRWASAPTPPAPEPSTVLTPAAPATLKEPLPTVAPTPASPKPSRQPANKARTKPTRKDKVPATSVATAPAPAPATLPVEKENVPIVQSQEEERGKQLSPSKTTAIPSLPTTPESTLPDLPETPGGDWWAEDDDDDEVAVAAQALQGISIKDTAPTAGAAANSKAKQERNASPTRQPNSHHNGTARNFAQQQGSHLHTPTSRHANPNTASTGNTALHDANSQKAKKPQTKATLRSTPAKSSAGTDLLSRLGPPVPLKQVENEPSTSASISAPSATHEVTDNSKLTSLTLEQLVEKARKLNTELRQLNHLKRYASAGAVLSNDQTTQIDQIPTLSQELSSLSDTVQAVAKEMAQLLGSARA